MVYDLLDSENSFRSGCQNISQWSPTNSSFTRTAAGQKNTLDKLLILLDSNLLLQKKVAPSQCNNWGGRGRGGAVVRVFASHQCGLDSSPGPSVLRWLSLLLVPYLLREVFLQVLLSPLLKNQHLGYTYTYKRVPQSSKVLRG